MRRLFIGLCFAFTNPTFAQEPSGFDYYVLALSWSPSWCEREGDARGSDQCHPRHDHGWILHGLWPQFEDGYPEYCPTINSAPTRRMTESMTDIMGTPGLALHQWRKHGTCTGSDAPKYFEESRDAYQQIKRPDILRRLTEEVRIAPSVIEAAFLDANPEFRPDQITVTCRDGYIQEVRICLDKSFEPRTCGPDVRKDCTVRSARLPPIR